MSSPPRVAAFALDQSRDASDRRLVRLRDWTSSAETENSTVVSAVERARQGSAEAFEELVLYFGPRLFRLLVLRLRSAEDARDVLQETFCAAWLDLARLRDPQKVASWLGGIAINKARTAVRRRAATPASGLQNLEVPVEPISTAMLELRIALDEIPEPLRDVLLARYVLGLSEKEAARALGVRVGTVKSRTARARNAVIDALGEHIGDIQAG